MIDIQDIIFHHPPDKGLVSVIIPAFNAGKYIHETIESVLSQDYPHLEILVVDDGSTDNTLQIVENFKRKDPRIRIFRQDRGGVAVARNTGIRHARGEFIAPLDADDIWYPDKISSQVQVMQERGTRTGLVYTWVVRLDSNSNLIGLCATSSYEGPVFGSLLTGNFISCASVPLIRRTCIETVGGYSTEFFSRQVQGCEDLDFHLRIAEQFDFGVVKKLLVGYRWFPESMSKNHRQMYGSFDLTIRRLKRRHPEIPDDIIKKSFAVKMFYLEGISYYCGDYKKCFYYMIKSAENCPSLMYKKFFLRLFMLRIYNFMKYNKRKLLNDSNYKKIPLRIFTMNQLQDMALEKERAQEGTFASFRVKMRSNVNSAVYEYFKN
jgi:glycosyltransferase involved in cell wall biosynthesis